MAINSVNSNNNISPVKTITKLVIGAGAAAAALAAAHKADSFTKITEKLGDKGEALKPVAGKLDKAGKVILEKVSGIATAAKTKATEAGLDKKAADVTEKAKTVGKGIVAKAQDTVAAVMEKFQNPEKFNPEKAADLTKLAEEMEEAAKKAGL